MEKKGIALLLVALVLAIAAGGGVYLYLKGMPSVQARGPALIPVVVAMKDMSFGTTIERECVQVVDFPKKAVPVGAYSSIDSVLSQTTKVFVLEGEPILASKLSAIGGGLSVRIPEYQRAMSLKVDEVTGVSGFVLPGDRVDVLVTVDNVGGANVAVTKTILQDLEVLAAGAKTETRHNQNITVQTVTVLLNPEGAEKLALGVQQGKVHLALRNPVDHKLVEGKTTDTRTVLGLAKSQAAPARSSAPRTTPQVKTTENKPVVVQPPFTVIRDGRIVKQENPTAEEKKSDKDSEGKDTDGK